MGGIMLRPPEPSPLSPLPSPPHLPGEGDLVEAVVPLGGHPTDPTDPTDQTDNTCYKHHDLSRVPLSRTAGGRWERGQG